MDLSMVGGRNESGWVGMAVGITLLVIALAAAVWFAYTNFEWTSEDASNNGGFETPAWNDVRQDVLPLAGPEETEPAVPTNEAVRPQVDARVAEIADNLNQQFARNPGQETAFTDAYPRRALQSWIRDRAGIPTDRRDHFIDSLVVASRAIGEDPMINRIGSVPERVKSVQDAVFAYRDEYLRRAEAAEQRVAEAKATEALRAQTTTRSRTIVDRIKPGPSLVHFVVFAIGGMALLAALVVSVLGVKQREARPPPDEPNATG